MSRLPARMEQLGSFRADFYEILYFGIFFKSAVKIQVLLKSDENYGCFTGRPIYIFDHISLNIP
jgi:hypothetical protein